VVPAVAAASAEASGAPAAGTAQTPAEPHSDNPGPAGASVELGTEIAGIAAHLISLKPAARGVIVLLSRASDEDPTPSFSLPLGRDLAESCRTVLVDLDRHADSLSHAAGLSAAPGLADLVANEIGFSDAIHRDPHSRLHIVPAGLSAEAPDRPTEARDLTVVLDALAQTYDAVLVDTRALVAAATMKALIAAVDVTLIVRGGADEAAMTATLERFAAEKPALLLAIEPAANDDRMQAAEVAA
jgi:Mrp family chromosome partitioning ATPase